MARVTFTQTIQRHISCPPTEAEGRTVREVLGRVFAANPMAREYVLDDQGAVRRHMVVFVNGRQITDRARLSDPVPAQGRLRVVPRLSRVELLTVPGSASFRLGGSHNRSAADGDHAQTIP